MVVYITLLPLKSECTYQLKFHDYKYSWYIYYNMNIKVEINVKMCYEEMIAF